MEKDCLFLTKADRLEIWGVHRRRGKLGFIIMEGLVEWGISTGAFWLLAMVLWDPAFGVREHAPLAFVVFGVGGAALGLLTWNQNEKDYLAYISTEKR